MSREDFDEITSFLGDYGVFQILNIVLLSLSTIPCGCMTMIVVFISDTPEHHCNVSSSINGSAVEPGRPDNCSRYKATGNWTEAAGHSNDTEQCADGWVFSTEIYTATIVSEWELVCDNAWKVPFSTSLFFVGVLVGSLISGQLSDRFGRKPVFFITMILQTVVTLIQATSISWVMFSIFNCLRGISQISSYISSLVLGSEMLGQSARVSFILLGHSLGFGIGYALLPLFAYFIRGWRMLLVATAIPGFLFIPTWWLIPESPRWLLQKGRVEEAERIIRNAAKTNRVSAPDVIFRQGECIALMKNKGEEEQTTYTYVDLIRTPNIRNITLLGVFIWLSVNMVFYGLSLNTSNLNGNSYLNCFISAAIDIAVYIATWVLANRLPRPTVLFSMLLFCGIVLLIIQLVPEDVIQVLAFVGKIGVSSAYCLIYMFFTELFPTVVRNMGLGITSTAARIGTIVCPYMLYMGKGVNIKILPYIIFGTTSILAAVVSMLLPDTRNSILPDLISQARPIRGCNCSKETAAAQSSTTEGCKEMCESAPC